MKKFCKSILFLMLAVTLLFSLSITALAANINLGVTITSTADKISVTVDNSIQYAPDTTLTIPCSFTSAQVKLGTDVLDDDDVTLADGKQRRVEKPKRKKRIHVRKVLRQDSTLAAKITSGEKILNSELRRELAKVSQQINVSTKEGS